MPFKCMKTLYFNRMSLSNAVNFHNAVVACSCQLFGPCPDRLAVMRLFAAIGKRKLYGKPYTICMLLIIRELAWFSHW